MADGNGLSQDCQAHRDEIGRLNKVIKEAERDLKQLSAYTEQNGSPRRRSAPDINSEALKVLQRKHARDMTQRRRSNSISGRSTPAATPGPRTPGTTQTARFNEEDMQSECLEGEDESGFAGLYTWTVVIDRTSGEPLGVDLAARGQHVLEVESIRDDKLFDVWNRSHPSQAVRPGDRFLEVNGERDVAPMVKLCQMPQALWITVGRDTNPALPSPLHEDTAVDRERCALLERKLKASREIANACKQVLLPYMHDIFSGDESDLTAEEEVVKRFLSNCIR